MGLQSSLYFFGFLESFGTLFSYELLDDLGTLFFIGLLHQLGTLDIDQGFFVIVARFCTLGLSRLLAASLRIS